MKVILKFPLHIAREQTIVMPVSAAVLALQVQQDRITLWAVCDSLWEQVPSVAREFVVVGTGHEFDSKGLSFIGTVQTTNGMFVWHVWERTQ